MLTWNEIKETVENNMNVHTVTMLNLRDATGKDKLGRHVCAEIHKELVGMGLGHIPLELPSSQHELVRIYKYGTPIGELIESVLLPGDVRDQKLRDRFNEEEGTVDYVAIVEQIRELVSE